MGIIEIRGECRAHFNERLRRAMEALPEMLEAHVLDMGCGSGESLCEMARTTDWQFTGVEPDASCLGVLREKEL